MGPVRSRYGHATVVVTVWYGNGHATHMRTRYGSVRSPGRLHCFVDRPPMALQLVCQMRDYAPSNLSSSNKATCASTNTQLQIAVYVSRAISPVAGDLESSPNHEGRWSVGDQAGEIRWKAQSGRTLISRSRSLGSSSQAINCP